MGLSFKVFMFFGVFLCLITSSQAQSVQQVELTFSNGSVSSQLILLFIEEGKAGNDLYDAYYLANLSGTYADLYSLNSDESKLVINTLPKDLDEILKLPIVTHTTFSGTFTITVSKYQNIPAGWSFKITDLQTDSVINLDLLTSYTFPVNNGTTQRFQLNIVPDSITTSITIPGTTAKDGWRFLGSPVSGQSYSAFLDALWTQGSTDSDKPSGSPNVFFWDETEQKFIPVNSLSNSMSIGKGIIAFVYEDDEPGTFGIQGGWPKTISSSGIPVSENVDFPISYSTGSEPSLNGFNLVSNPYTFSIDWDDPDWTKTNIQNAIWIWDPNANEGNGDYKEYATGVGDPINIIAPGQAFWIKATSANPELKVTELAQTTGGAFLKRSDPQAPLKLTLQSGDFEDRHYISFQENGKITIDEGDIQKLPTLSTDFLSISSLAGNTPLAIQNLPRDLSEIQIPLEIKTSLKQDFSILMEWDDKRYSEFEVRLIDPVQDKRFHLLDSQVLTIDNHETHYSLILDFRKKTQTSNSTNTDKPEGVALIQNYPNPFNPVTIISYQLNTSAEIDLRVFDMLGREVKILEKGWKPAGAYTVTFSADNLVSGIYIYRLKAGNTTINKKMSLLK